MKITWLGQSSIQIVTDDKLTILIDPFIKDNPLVKTTIEELNPDYILVTHAHYDHVGDTIELAKKSGAKVVTINDLANYFEDEGLIVEPLNFGGQLKLPFGSVKLIPAWHTAALVIEGTARTLGVAAGFEMHIDGKVLYHAGDTALFSDMKLVNHMEPVDLAFLPIGDTYTMGLEDAAIAAEFVQAKKVVPIHYNTFSKIEQNPVEFVQLLNDGVGIIPEIDIPFEF
ncbi:metal-dependent hydrolase [Dellaglioa sp. P0083]|uniref:metal-dependent hydrolase n=1 Tax=Dellaglioa kimchii TaxID=3344667 RepID=UPI0038D3DDD2